MLYFFISQGDLHPLHAWSRVPSSVHWYGVDNTNIQKVLFTFPGRGEVRALHRTLDRVGRAGTRPGTCSVTPRNRGSLWLLLNKVFPSYTAICKDKNSEFPIYCLYRTSQPQSGNWYYGKWKVRNVFWQHAKCPSVLKQVAVSPHLRNILHFAVHHKSQL